MLTTKAGSGSILKAVGVRRGSKKQGVVEVIQWLTCRTYTTTHFDPSGPQPASESAAPCMLIDIAEDE